MQSASFVTGLNVVQNADRDMWPNVQNLTLGRLKLLHKIIAHKDPVRTAQLTLSSVIKIDRLMLYREIIAVCSQIHTKHINTLCGQNVELYIKTQSVSRSKHSVSVIKTSQLMLYREIIAVCSQIHTKHINTLCGQNVELYTKTQSVPRSKHTPSRL